MRRKWVSQGVIALFGVVQVLMLAMASVSPRLHEQLYHADASLSHPAEQVTGCAHGHFHETQADDGAQPHDAPESDPEPKGHDDHTCPVTFFSQGLTFSLPDTGGINAPQTGRISYQETCLLRPLDQRRDALQARAPPSAT